MKKYWGNKKEGVFVNRRYLGGKKGQKVQVRVNTGLGGTGEGK